MHDGQNVRNSDNTRLSGSNLYDNPKNGSDKNILGDGNVETIPKLEANLKNV